MRERIFTLGLPKSVIAITGVSLFLALIFTFTIELLLQKIGITVYPLVALFITVSVTLIVAPIISWSLLSLLVEIHRLEEEMRKLATYDSLTGLLSRHVFLEKTDYFYKIAKRDGLEFSVVFVDLDNFKEINDLLGHAAGDKALEAIGKTIKDILRESDLACRYGGDEFVFFLPNTSSEQTQKFTERFHTRIGEIQYDDLQIHFSVSIGLATYPEVEINSIGEIIDIADKAQYRAKNNGGNQTYIITNKKRVDKNDLI